MSDTNETGLLGLRAKEAARALARASSEQKNQALLLMARAVEQSCAAILEENREDLKSGRESGLSDALLDRLSLSETRIREMAKGIAGVAELPDPIGRLLWETERPNGLKIKKVSVPLGVIAVIFEARPNVTADAAALCLKAGSAVLLRGGKEAVRSSLAICRALRAALRQSELPADCIQLVADASHESAEELMRMNGYVDVLIPRGGARLIRAVLKKATVPVIETGVGNCHVYVDKDADPGTAADIVYNAKTSRPSVCNAAETLLIHKDVAESLLPEIRARLDEKQVELRGDAAARSILPGIRSAGPEDWGKEYLDYIMAVRVVADLDEAVRHIEEYGTGHSECIVTEDEAAAREFTARVDAAVVYCNASTRFTDGGEFGFGAELGISTQKLHARGPIGLEQLTSYKYQVTGNGQVR